MAEKMSAEELERALSFLEHHERAAHPEAATSRAAASVRAHIAFLQSEADRLRQSIAWVGEVYPDTNHESGGAIVHMTWDQFNAMREMVGLKSVKPARARAALSATQQDASPVQPAQKTE
jgi:hypothetical protein